jgi:hypothetical protein
MPGIEFGIVLVPFAACIAAVYLIVVLARRRG